MTHSLTRLPLAYYSLTFETTNHHRHRTNDLLFNEGLALVPVEGAQDAGDDHGFAFQALRCSLRHLVGALLRRWGSRTTATAAASAPDDESTGGGWWCVCMHAYARECACACSSLSVCL